VSENRPEKKHTYYKGLNPACRLSCTVLLPKWIILKLWSIPGMVLTGKRHLKISSLPVILIFPFIFEKYPEGF
jgi:hypothetical protein